MCWFHEYLCLFSCLSLVIAYFGHIHNIVEYFTLDYHYHLSGIWNWISWNFIELLHSWLSFLRHWNWANCNISLVKWKWVIEFGIVYWNISVRQTVFYSIGSRLVVVITRIYFAIQYLLTFCCSYFDPLILISSQNKHHLHSRLPRLILSLRTT